MPITDAQRKTVVKLLEKFSFSEFSIACPNNGETNIIVHIKAGTSEMTATLNEKGRKV